MKSSDIVGRKVVAVRQTRVRLGGLHSPYVNLDEIEFDGGVILRFVVREGEFDYGIEGIIVRTKRSARPKGFGPTQTQGPAGEVIDTGLDEIARRGRREE